MNYKILDKVLSELCKDEPDISYIKGMIETLISFSDASPVARGLLGTMPPQTNGIIRPLGYAPTVTDAGRMPNIAGIQDMVAKSVQTDG